MDKEPSWRFGTKKFLLVYFALIPLMFLALLIYIALKDGLKHRTMYVVLYACLVALFSANFRWVLKFPLISLRDNKIVISTGLLLRKVLQVEYISSVSLKYKHALIKLSNGDSVRFPMFWLDAVEQVQLENLLREIVQDNQGQVGEEDSRVET